MPKLLEKTKRIRHKRFLTALERTGSPAQAALETLNIGSRGAKNIENSASAAGSQMLARIKETMVDALERNGVTTDKIAKKTDDLLESQDPIYIDKGITQAMKMGLGGGYSPEKSVSMNVNIEATEELKELSEQFNEFMKKQ